MNGLDEDLEYECPECGTYFPAGSKRCPGCRAELDWEDETVEEPQEETASEPTVPKEEVEEEEPEEPPEEAPEEKPGIPEEEAPEEEPEEPEEEAPKEEPEVHEEEAPEEEVPEEIPPEEVLEEIPPVEPKGPRLYGGLFSALGLTFVVLTVLALIATNIALRWDIWISGAAEETIGDHQRLYIYLGVAGIVVCAVVSVVDILRHRKEHRG